jgi:hypothetical protein
MLNYWQRLEYLDSFPILQSAYDLAFKETIYEQ